MKRLGLVTLIVLFVAVLSLTACISFAQTQVNIIKDESVSMSKSDIEAAQAKMSKKVTHAQREAAAKRLAELRAKTKKTTANRSSINGKSSITAAPLVPLPGGIPDYLGYANWANSPAIRKFVDTLPGLGPDNANNLGQFVSVAVPDTITYPGSDYYEISVRQFTEQLHSDLSPTTLRGYVQTNKGTDVSGQNTVVPAPIRYLGPLIIAQKNRPVRIKFTNELPTGEGGKLFVPVDTTVMGSGMGPSDIPGFPGMRESFTQNRAVIHLHGGHTPWISDGTPHQWITPAGEATSYPVGVSMQNVPDMPDPGPGSQTYYYSNQQSARLLFYHDHSWGITRLNVYVGEVAGYLLQDATEAQLVSSGVVPAEQIPLIIQDKSFVDVATVRATDPTWNWGTGAVDPVTGYVEPKSGDLWYPHVYVPAQNPYDIGGANPYGRWHYGPWFWPPTSDIPYGPVPNPYYDPINAPWEPPEMPGTPNPSMPGESFFDVAMVNGTAYPVLNVEPKAYRFRILNGSNDRFWNLQMYEADSTVTSSDGRTQTEVKMVDAAPGTGLPANWPKDGREGGVPDPTKVGPNWIQIGTEGGFLPAPAVIPSQPIAWNMNPTTFNFGNVTDHSLLLGCAERADVIVDFSQYAGKTLILYNDAPAAFPALDPRYDYYTGAPDLTEEGGHSGPQAGFAPNTRTVMQIKVANNIPAAPFDLTALENAFKSTDTTPGVFASGQNPILVGQSAYDSAYNTTFPKTWPLWGYSRIQDHSMTFKTPAGTTVTIPFEPKALHDEMGAAFDDYGRMSGKLGLELKNTSALTQNFILQNYVDPATEIVDDCVIAGVVAAGDGTQIWRITHNGVDTHPIHFHLFDVQLLNRVGWDGAIRLPDANELGWKDTIRMSPLEDTIVAVRATASQQPFGLPDSIRPLNPAEPVGSLFGFTSIDPLTGEAIIPAVSNEITNFGWEYVWHCHILSHEEMDMMRPIKLNVGRSLAVAPVLDAAVNGTINLSWTDATPGNDPATIGNLSNEIGFKIERALGNGVFAVIGKALANQTSFVDNVALTPGITYRYRVTAFNAAGDSVSNIKSVAIPPTAPSNLRASSISTTFVILGWNDNSNNEQGFYIERSSNGTTGWSRVGQTAANSTLFRNTGLTTKTTYFYRVQSYIGTNVSAYSNIVQVKTN